MKNNYHLNEVNEEQAMAKGKVFHKAWAEYKTEQEKIAKRKAIKEVMAEFFKSEEVGV